MIADIGMHRVRHGDVMDTDGINLLMGDDRADIFYSDPPWGEGNLKYWQTMNQKMTGTKAQPVDLDKFLHNIFSIAVTYTNRVILIEYGVRWYDMIKQRGEAFGLTHYGAGNCLYRSGSKLRPLHLHLFGKGQLAVPQGYFQGLTDTTAMKTLRQAVMPFAEPGKIILDPCCGMGYTAQVALETGMVFRGNELNYKRLAKTIKRLQRK